MGAPNLEKILQQIHKDCRMKVSEARELSWRMFYKEAGGKENLAEMDGKPKLAKLFRVCEDCFANIMENKLSDEELIALIALPPTDIWIKDGNAPIILKGTYTTKTP